MEEFGPFDSNFNSHGLAISKPKSPTGVRFNRQFMDMFDESRPTSKGQQSPNGEEVHQDGGSVEINGIKRQHVGLCRKQPRENWRKEFFVFFSLN